MANTLRVASIVFQLVGLVYCITTADNKKELTSNVKDIDAEDIQDDLKTQETGWIFNPLQAKARELDNLKDKIFLYPFSALKSPGTSTGGGYPVYGSGASNNYYPGFAGSYPSYSVTGSGNYYQPAKPKQYQYYNPLYTSYKKSYPYYPSKTWYNKHYTSAGGYHINTATYAPDCYQTLTGPTFQSPPAPSYSSGTPLYYYYSGVAPSNTYGAPSFNVGVKSSIGVSSTPAPISHYSYPKPSYVPQTPPSSYLWRVSSSPQQISHSSGSFPSVPSVTSTPAPQSFSTSTYSPSHIPVIVSGPSTPLPPVSHTATPQSLIQTSSLPSIPELSNNVPSVPSFTPIPIVYSQSDDVPNQEIVITPPPPSSQSHYVTTLPGSKIALPESSYIYNQPPSYAVAYYPNVFYITNEQRVDKTSAAQSVAGTSEGPSEESTTTSTPASDSQSTTSEDSTPSTKSQSSVQTLPGPGLTSFYSSQTLDQTRIPISYNSGQYVLPQTQGVFYSSPFIPGVNGLSPTSTGSGAYVALSRGAPAESIPNTVPTYNYPTNLGYIYGQSPIGYQITRTSKNC